MNNLRIPRTQATTFMNTVVSKIRDLEHFSKFRYVVENYGKLGA